MSKTPNNLGESLYFVLAIGRSGTKWLADVLDSNHEPIKEDSIAYRHAFHSPKLAKEYIRSFRSQAIEKFKEGKDTYGEVNSYLRRHTAALKEFYPEASFVHLVRDPKMCIRSMYSRGTMGPRDAGTVGIFPKEGEYAEKWYDMDRFQRLCWYWKIENEYLREHIDDYFRLEDISDDYEEFQKLTEKFGLEVSREKWETDAKNTTKSHKLPHPDDWSEKRYEQYRQICGTEAVKYNYE